LWKIARPCADKKIRQAFAGCNAWRHLLQIGACPEAIAKMMARAEGILPYPVDAVLDAPAMLQ
jgi:hypothetical protein